MRKVTDETVTAFLNNKKVSCGNTVVTVDEVETAMFLHGNKIAMALKNVRGGHTIYISNCGWESNTTKERLNGIISEVSGHADKIYQKNHCWKWKDGEPFPHNTFVQIN